MACLCTRRRIGGRRAAGRRKAGHEEATGVEEVGQKSAEREKRTVEFIVGAGELKRGGLGEGGDEEEEEHLIRCVQLKRGVPATCLDQRRT